MESIQLQLNLDSLPKFFPDPTVKKTRAMSSTNDPRQPTTAKPYASPLVAPEDMPVDYSGFIAVLFGVAGVMFRYKLCSWLAIIFCAQSLANMRNIENDLKQISMASMFAIMGLVTNYMGPPRPGSVPNTKT
ncbi:Protein Asterix [Linum perenne]